MIIDPVMVGIVLAVMAFFGLFLALYSWQRKNYLGVVSQIADLEQQIKMTSEVGIGVGRKVISLERRLQAAEKKQKEVSETDLQKVSYNEAVNLLSLGADVDDLVQSCGLSRTEADLIVTLHNGRKSLSTQVCN